MQAVLIPVSFLSLDSKQKKVKIKTRTTMALQYHSKLRSTQNKEVLFFSCLCHGV